MRECFPFYQLTKRLYRGDLADERVLDFGVGWGRLIRLFAHDVPANQLFGVDVDADILEVCAQTGVPGTLSLVEPGTPTAVRRRDVRARLRLLGLLASVRRRR